VTRDRELSRRELLTALGVGALTGGSVVGAGTPPRVPGRVGLSRVQPARPLDAGVARRAIAGALAAATGSDSGAEAVGRLFGPRDVVGIKVNCLAGRRLSPRVELVEALAGLVAGAGVAPANIIVFERSSRELRDAGFEVRRRGGRFRCFGVDNDWDRLPTVSGEIGSCYARLVTETCTALVSFGVVKDHDLAGVSAGLKNWYGVIHNPNKYHDNCCDPYVADVVRHHHIRSKLRLTVLDGITAQCKGGPAFLAAGQFELGWVAASTDPIAADVWAWRVLDEERLRRGLPSLEEAGRPPRFLATAARHGLGVADRERLLTVVA
jgi:uncharacterized protein (DUF362 family)